MTKTKIGITVGKFDPLHMGHVNYIQSVSSDYDKTIIIISHNENKSNDLFKASKLKRHLTAKDKLAIIQKTFQKQQLLIIPILVDETDVPEYPNGWSQWHLLVKHEIINNRRVTNEIASVDTWNAFIESVDTTFIVNEDDDLANYKHYFSTKAVSYDTERDEYPISATMIRNSPYRYWEYIPRASRYLLTPRIAICGGESSGKSIMTNKLANIYATTSVDEYGRTITESELGGDESALQYRNYTDISNGHYQDMKFALTHANRVMFSDTDFVATQAFCMMYEGRRNPMVQEYINDVVFDLTILLDNSTRWVDDGMRMLGENDQRNEFQTLLKELYRENGIQYVEIKATSYRQRYELVKKVVRAYLEKGLSIDELQVMVNKEESGNVK